jgi:hypothetical protein
MPMILHRHAFPHPKVPISEAVADRGFRDHLGLRSADFDPKNIVFDAEGNFVDDGTGRKDTPFDEQVHLTFGFVREALALAGCVLDEARRSALDCRRSESDPSEAISGRISRARAASISSQATACYWKIRCGLPPDGWRGLARRRWPWAGV